jgi:hypothetical protein
MIISVSNFLFFILLLISQIVLLFLLFMTIHLISDEMQGSLPLKFDISAADDWQDFCFAVAYLLLPK